MSYELPLILLFITSNISVLSNCIRYRATSGFPSEPILLDTSSIASNPVFIVGYEEYKVAS